MATPTAMHAAIAIWQFRRPQASSAPAEAADADRARRFLRSVARSRLPVYRDYGIVFALAVLTEADGLTTVTVYSSIEGLTEGVANLPATGGLHGEIYDRVVPVKAPLLGPMTDIFHLSKHSTLRTLERDALSEPAERDRSEFMHISTWRIRDDGVTWPNGMQPRSIPVDERWQQFQRTVKAWMASRQEITGMINGWVVNTGDGGITFLAMFIDAGSCAAWTDLTADAEGDLRLTDYLELIEQSSGPVIDLIRLGNEPDEAAGEESESDR